MVLLGFTSMIIQEFSFPEDALHYFVGLGSLIITKLELDDIFNLIEIIQNRHEGVMLQFFNRKLILNYNHIFYACYHTLKTFHLKKNISNKMGIELLLYLAANRQIKKAIEYYGITTQIIHQGTIDFCIVSRNNNLDIIRKDLLKETSAEEIDLDLAKSSYDKYERIKEYFGINKNQIKTVLESYRILIDDTRTNIRNIENLYLAIEDLICEKMVLLSLEKSRYELESAD